MNTVTQTAKTDSENRTWTPETINPELEIEPGNVSIAVKESEAAFMYDFISEHKCERTLEVGMGYGRSASHILAASENKHIAMDPFQTDYDRQGVKNVEKLGFGDRLDFHGDFSHNVLPKLHKEGETFDFIFIDGDHKFDGVFVDFYYADLLLEEGGHILFHDTWMRSTQLVTSFVKNNRSDYEFVRTGLRNLCMVKKVGQDYRNGMYCREFYTPKNLLVHNGIMWMNEGEKTPLKRLAFWLKEKIK